MTHLGVLAGLAVWLMMAVPSRSEPLDVAALATFLPEPEPGWVLTNTKQLHSEGPGAELWVGGLFEGDPNFVIHLFVDPDVHAKFNGMMEDTSLIEGGIEERVQVDGVEIAVTNYGQEYYAVLPGDVVIYLFSYGDHVMRHISMIDFQGLSAAAMAE